MLMVKKVFQWETRINHTSYACCMKSTFPTNPPQLNPWCGERWINPAYYRPAYVFHPWTFKWVKTDIWSFINNILKITFPFKGGHVTYYFLIEWTVSLCMFKNGTKFLQYSQFIILLQFLVLVFFKLSGGWGGKKRVLYS